MRNRRQSGTVGVARRKRHDGLMTDEQLSAILTSIMDILTEMNTAYSDDHGQMPAILKTRELIAAARASKPLPFGSGNVSV